MTEMVLQLREEGERWDRMDLKRSLGVRWEREEERVGAMVLLLPLGEEMKEYREEILLLPQGVLEVLPLEEILFLPQEDSPRS
jgi:hypothetical protein